MRLIRRFVVPAGMIFLATVVAGCSGTPCNGCSPGPATGGAGDEGGDTGTGGSSTSTGGSSAGSGGHAGSSAGGSGGSTGGSGGSDTVGGSGGSDTGGAGGSDGTPDASSGSMEDAAPVTTYEAGAGLVDSHTPMTIPGAPPPSYDGEIPLYYGPPIGPIVKMDCPDDPTAGWTEYQDTFHVEHPYTLPTNKRFSITDGIYNFWVFPPDAPHSPDAQGRNPRTEARYGKTADAATGGNFQHGMRMFTADMLVEKNAVGSAIMQIHTTTTGGGPIGIRMQSNSDIVNNGSLTVVKGSDYPGGLIDKWFNYKASLNADTLEVKIYINNCLKSTYKGDKGDGNFYFKHGVYFCKTSTNGCFSHYKNIHLYKK